MNIFSRILLTLLCLPSPMLSISPVFAETETLQLLGRSNVKDYRVELDESDWSWLRSKGTLWLGTSAPDNTPFDIMSTGKDFEGITADFATLLGELLHVKVEVMRYDSRDEVIQALKAGKLDFLGTANGFEAVNPELVLSQAYALDQPTLVTRTDDTQTLAPDLAGKQVAMLYHYLDPETVRNFYPKAKLKFYPSTQSAIGAVAFGQADVYLGDATSASYFINNNYLNNVHLVGFSRMEVNNFAFAFARSNHHLLRIVNSALGVIPASESMSILRRWSASDSNVSGNQTLHFSAAEKRWIEKNPRLKVVVNENLLPLSYFDDNGNFRGISADVLAKISLLTGLKFEVLRRDSVHDLIEQVKTGSADVLAAFTPSAERESELRFTRPYLSTPFVLISRPGSSSPNTLDDMSGKRLAMVRGNILRSFVSERFPHVQIVNADSAADAMALVAQGKVDAAVNSLISARYIISRHYHDQLRVTSTVGMTPARIAFATDRGALELYSILQKALLSIPPEEMEGLTNRWRSEAVVDDSYWLKNRTVIIQGFTIATILLLAAIAWITNLRRFIRQRRLVEVALSDQIEFMRVLIDGTPHPIYVRDREGRLVSCNSGYLDFFAVKREAVIGKKIPDGLLAEPARGRAYHEEYLQVMDEGLPRVQDLFLTMADGRAITIYHWLLPYRDSGGAVIGMIAGWIDISERQRLLSQIQDAKNAAEDANRAKTTFLAMMSHEIRTPMNAVLGMLELALVKADQGILDRFAIDVASGAARGLLDLIGDILDIAKIESGRLTLSPERANLRELVESLVLVFEGLARQKHLQLVLDFDVMATCDVLVDSLRFKQIVSNLLSNAIKFTFEGEVRLTLEVLPSLAQEHLSIRLLVEDSGMGISGEEQHRLFTPFSQASNNTQSARSGSGLGLVISRNLCEMMGGQLQLKSTLGKGTQVEVSLNLLTLESLPASEVITVDRIAQRKKLNILIVDDYPANRLLLSQQLGYLGHRAVDAEDGALGLQAWRSDHFDVVISDCNMPTMNGYALATAIRVEELENNRQPCLILGFTANAQLEEKDRCIAAGMDDCLFKPISLKDLKYRLASLMPATNPSLTVKGVTVQAGALDLTNLEQLTRGDEVSMKNLLKDLVSSNQGDLGKLKTVFLQQDLQGLADLAHRVKGGARIIKAQALILACEQLEATCQVQGDGVALENSVSNLKREMEELDVILTLHCN